MNIEMNFSAKLSDEWTERTVKFNFSYWDEERQRIANASESCPTHFQKWEKVWNFSPHSPFFKEVDDIPVEIGIAISPIWVSLFASEEKYKNVEGFEWYAHIPYMTRNSKYASAYGKAETLEEAMKNSENWIASCLEIK